MQLTGFTYKASDVTDFWTLADTNLDGFLTANEVKNAVEDQKTNTMSLAYTQNQKVNLIFYYYDADKNNFLDVSEVQKIITDAYGMSNLSDAQWFLGQLDTNYDQKLSWNEVAAVVQ